MSLSKIRHYSLPTCTLKIGTRQNSLLQRIKKTQQEDNYFELHFNNFATTEKSDLSRAIICGDRSQFQQLNLAVNDYVRKFLARNSVNLNLETNRVKPELQSNLIPSLQPKSMLVHELFLGSLATEKSGKKIELTALQLFDLATALEKYATDISQRAARKPQTSLPRKIFAASAIAAIGLIAIAIKLFNPSTPQTQTISSSKETEIETSLTETENKPFEVLPPASPETNSDRAIPSLPTPTADKSAIEKLPPPPPVKPPHFITKIPATPVKPKKNELRSQPYIIDSNSLNSQARSRANNSEKKYTFRDPKIAIRDTNRNTKAETDILVEVDRYLKQKWQPPQELNKTLEYRLIINKDGSIASVIPFGYPSQLYRDRTGIPSPGEAFVSQLQEAETLKIRVFLTADGKVNAFIE